jgi:hypothetical protein
LARILITVVAIITLIATGILLVRGVRTKQIYVPSRDFPAFHQLTEADIRERDIAVRDIPSDAITSKGDLIDRYTLKRVTQDKPMTDNDLGPELAKGALKGRLATGLTLDAGNVLVGELTAGDQVSLFSSAPAPAARPLRNVLVLDVRQLDARSYALLVAITRTQQSQFAKLRQVSVRVIRSQPFLP